MTFESENTTRFSTGMSFPVAVGLGLVRGFSRFAVSGIKIDIPVTDVDFSEFTDVYVFPSDSGEAIEVVSDNIGDTVPQIEVIGLDENGLEKSEIVTLNGTTAVALPGLWSRINQTQTRGTTETVGDISIQASGGGTIFSKIFPLRQRSFDAIFTIPKNKRAMVLGLITTISKAVGSNATVVVILKVRPPGEVFRTQFAAGLQRDGDTSPEFVNNLPFALPGFTDIKFRIESSASSIDALIRSTILLIDDDEA